MNYRNYTAEYRDRQRKRIADSAQKIAGRADAVKAGRLVPEHADIPIGTGRRVKAAVLFLDICGFTGRLSNTQDEQETLLRGLSVFFTEMFRIVNDYGGVVEKNTGDGLMAYFADAADANGAERAAACAATMQAANEELAPYIRRVGLEPIEFRIGIDYGDITIAQIGAAKLFGSIVAIGATANIACKMLREGGPGQIIMGQKAGVALPAEWKKHCLRLESPSGFVYVYDDSEYPFYLFNAVWNKPAELAVPARLPAPPPRLTPPPITPPPIFAPPPRREAIPPVPEFSWDTFRR